MSGGLLNIEKAIQTAIGLTELAEKIEITFKPGSATGPMVVECISNIQALLEFITSEVKKL